MVLTGESVECLRNGNDRGNCGIFYGMVLTGESVEYLRNCTDRGKCGVFTELY